MTMAEAPPSNAGQGLPPRPSNLMRRVTKAMPVVSIWKDTKYRMVMQGRLSDLPPVDTKVIRIFISSTFSDMACERNELMRNVYPLLKDYCREKHGMEFQVIDMRWGVRSDRQLDHKGPLLCYQEIINCQSLSMGPSFIVMLGQRYGGHPPPPSIDTEEFGLLLRILEEKGESTEILREWYKCDENNIPPVHTLRPIVDEGHEKDEEAVLAAKMEWWEAETKILTLLHIGAKAATESGQMEQEEASKFFCSVTENEIRLGLFKAAPHIKKYAIAFIRKIEDLETHLKHPRIVKFLDCKETVIDGKIHNAVDESLKGMMDVLKDQKIADHLPTPNIHRYSVTFKDGINEDVHDEYLSQFSDDFYDRTKQLIDNSLRERSIYADDDVYNEVLQHLDTCVRYVRHFQGRVEIIERIQSYIKGDSDKPLVVFGASGSGKTSILGKAASLSLSWLPEELQDTAVMVLRFLGTSPATSSISQTMKSICCQLAGFAGEHEMEQCRSLEDFKTIVNTFYELLEHIGRQPRRVCVFLDSLDQLDSSSGAFHLTWLHTKLPPNIKLVVSTLPDMYGILDTLRAKLLSAACFVEVQPLEQTLCQSILRSLLNEKSRDLTAGQWDIVNEAFQRCSLPIFVHLVFHEVLNWKSFEQSETLHLEDSVRGAIFQLFRNLENKHGKVFTAHALSYITASRNGLSESELEDLLSLDDDVLRDVFEFHLPPLIRIPPLCWSRLRQDVGNYLVEREADNTRVLYWYHRQFIEVAREYFLKDETFQQLIHSRMVDYFLGTWGGGKKKPFRYPEKLVKKLKLPDVSREDRIVPTQPYVLEESQVRTRFNLRKLNELPFHLVHARRMNEFNDYIVFDFDFLLNKLRGTSRYLLLRDLELPSDEGVENIEEAQLVYKALRLAAYTLVTDPTNLVVDLLARLTNFEENNPRTRLLLQQVRQHGPEYSCLMPTRQFFESGSEALSTSFDVGLSMGIVLHDGLIAVISLVANEIEIYDVNGNHLKTFKTNHNIFLGLKYLLRLMPLRQSCYNLVVYGPMHGVLKELEKHVEEFEASRAKIEEEDRLMDEALSLEKDEEEKMEKEIEEKEETEETEKEKGDQEKNKEKNEEETEKEDEKNDGEEEIDDSMRPIDVIRMDFSTGNVDVMWHLPPKLRKNVSLDDVDFVGNRYFAKIPKKYFTTLTVFDIKEQTLLMEQTDCFLWASDVSNDERICYWSKQPDAKQSCQITFRNLETQEEFVHTTDKDSTWRPLWIVYMKDEICVFWVKDNDKRRPFLQVFKTDRIIGDSDEDRFKVEYECQLEPKEHWSKIITTMGQGNRELMRSRFLSHDFNKCVILYNNRNHFPGFVWKKSTRQWVALDDSCLEKEVKNVISSSWADGTQAFFPFDRDFLITTATKALMVVWSIETGQLLRFIRMGTAEGLLGGQIDDRFVLFHFPDESQGDTEKMFIMAKFYNLNFICKPESEDDKEEGRSLPNFLHKQIKLLYTSRLAPHLLIYEDPKDGMIFDMKKFETVYRGVLKREPAVMKDVANVPPEYERFVRSEKQTFPAKDLWKLRENDNASTEGDAEKTAEAEKSENVAQHSAGAGDENNTEAKKTEMDAEKTAEEETEGDSDEAELRFGNDGCAAFVRNGKDLCSFIDTDLLLEMGSNMMWAESFTVRKYVGFYDADREVFLTAHAREYSTDISFSVTNKKMEKVWKGTKDMLRLGKDEDDAEIKFVIHLSRRPGNSGQALLVYARKAKFVDMTKMTKTLNWEGCVDVINYAAINPQEVYDENRAEECGLTITKGPIFDVGPVVHFLSDGCHLINYRLHIHDFITGEVKREIVSDQPDFLFVNSFLSRDESFILGFRIKRPYHVDFEIDETPDDDETIAEDSPRNLQIYRLSDGKRMANYVFEVDPSTVLLVNEDRLLIVAIHNNPLLIFKLMFHSTRPVTTKGTRRPHTASRQSLARCPTRGPKRSYLADLDLMPLLSNAMSSVVEARPADPIAFLANFLKAQVEENRRLSDTKDVHSLLSSSSASSEAPN